MTNGDNSNVSAAFEMLLEEVETEVDWVQKDGAKAFTTGDLDGARDALVRAERIAAFRSRVMDLRSEWDAMSPPAPVDAPVDEPDTPTERRNLGRLQRGQRTREEAYYHSILRALVGLGGRAEMQAVIDRVGSLMDGKLKPVDFECLPSRPEQPRWENAVQWARAKLVEQGLMKSDSPRGVWEITDNGRKQAERSTSG